MKHGSTNGQRSAQAKNANKNQTFTVVYCSLYSSRVLRTTKQLALIESLCRFCPMSWSSFVFSLLRHPPSESDEVSLTIQKCAFTLNGQQFDLPSTPGEGLPNFVALFVCLLVCLFDVTNGTHTKVIMPKRQNAKMPKSQKARKGEREKAKKPKSEKAKNPKQKREIKKTKKPKSQKEKKKKAKKRVSISNVLIYSD